MQKEIEKFSPGAPIQILGVNAIEQEPGNASICDGRDIPWLQETTASPIWAPWNVAYRDVVVLDRNNEIALVFNLSHYSLAYPGNYAALRDSLLEVAAATDGVGRAAP
ncbi:MAG: hypothetical protein R3E12_02475 [Candidatus Eisenbacteria bacterium]|uniref:Uncharacterized protein n=1 Tax=Eiseniibacteriota bacterium TaxID=2212470 RepID=A0A956LVG3_UNCEI|nr:hypothetical protein [Candidatus Eisenbacteria bacterium]